MFHKTFFSQLSTDSLPYTAQVFVTFSHFHPSLIFVSKFLYLTMKRGIHKTLYDNLTIIFKVGVP